MSAICGVIYPEDLHDPREMIERRDILMLAMSHRGPDGSGIWNNNRVALGHQMLHITPESIGEQQPAIRHDNRLVCVADCRIDNRDELIEILGIKKNGITDSDLILDAYEEWGESCVKRFVGDFTFAIWDDVKKKLFCGRDHYGVRQFFYLRKKGVLYFSTELQALLKLPLEKTVDLDRLKYFFGGCLPDQEEESTFYKDIKSLIPARFLRYTDKIEVKRYWLLDRERKEPALSEEEFIESCRAKLEEAVKSRIRTEFNIGSELSGGIDSSTVTVLARHLSRQKEFYSVHVAPGGTSNEKEYAESVAEKSNIELLVHEGISPLSNYKERLARTGEPWNMANSVNVDVNSQRLSEKGIRVCLNGHFGDVYGTIDFAFEEYKNNMDWSGFTERLKINFPHIDIGVAENEFLKHELKRYAATHNLLKFLKVVRQIKRKNKLSAWYLLKKYYLRELIKKERGNCFIKPGYLPKKNSMQFSGNCYDMLFDHLSNVALAQAYQNQDVAYSWVGIQAVSPLADIRLIDFMYNTPIHLHHNKGLNRYLLRNAVRDELPDKVYNRKNKFFFDDFISKRMKFDDSGVVNKLLKNKPRLSRCMDVLNVGKWEDICDEDSLKFRSIWSLALSECWLQQFDLKLL